MRKLRILKTSFLITVVNVVVALILLNIVVSTLLPYVRIDLTNNKIHTLSPATVKMVKNLKDLVKIKVYLSEDLPPEVKPLATNLKTVLGEISSVNKKELQVSYVDPNKDSAAKTEALRYGITPLQFTSAKSDKLEVAQGYFGLALIYGNKQVVLSVAGDVGNLEYFLVSGIKKLTATTLPKILVATGNGEISNDEMQIFTKYASDNYQLDTVDFSKDNALEGKTGVLVVVGPSTTFSKNSLEQIQQWIEAKKPALFLVSAAAVDSSLQGKMRPQLGIEALLKNQGIEVKQQLILDQSSGVASFRTNSGGFYTQYPYWIQIRPENINQSLPPLSGLESLLLPWSSPLVVDGKAKVVVTSSVQSWTTSDLMNLSPLAKMAAGNDTGKKPVVALNTDSARLAVIGNSDLIKDQFISTDQQNLVLVFNLIDYLGQDDSLLAIRTKTMNSAPLQQVGDSQKQIIRWVAVGLPVGLLVIIGLSFMVFRKRRQFSYDV